MLDFSPSTPTFSCCRLCKELLPLYLIKFRRVQLDYESGEVTFSNPVSMTPIHTFTEKMFPFFCPGANINGNNPKPLKICPAKVAVWNSATW